MREGENMETKDELVVAMNSFASMLEQAIERLSQRESLFAEDSEARIGRIVAAVDARREAELEEKLAAAEAKITELQAREGIRTDLGRKTLPSAMASLLSKQGVTLESLDAGALDAALVSLSVEQRIAVKAQLMRAGLIG
jgi:hypothetical protein